MMPPLYYTCQMCPLTSSQPFMLVIVWSPFINASKCSKPRIQLWIDRERTLSRHEVSHNVTIIVPPRPLNKKLYNLTMILIIYPLRVSTIIISFFVCTSTHIDSIGLDAWHDGTLLHHHPRWSAAPHTISLNLIYQYCICQAEGK